jgi:hypothetical protein
MVAHPIVPATQEMEIGRLWSEASLGKSMRPYLKNKLKKKKKTQGLAEWLKQ